MIPLAYRLASPQHGAFPLRIMKFLCTSGTTSCRAPIAKHTGHCSVTPSRQGEPWPCPARKGAAIRGRICTCQLDVPQHVYFKYFIKTINSHAVCCICANGKPSAKAPALIANYSSFSTDKLHRPLPNARNPKECSMFPTRPYYASPCPLVCRYSSRECHIVSLAPPPAAQIGSRSPCCRGRNRASV